MFGQKAILTEFVQCLAVIISPGERVSFSIVTVITHNVGIDK